MLMAYVPEENVFVLFSVASVKIHKCVGTVISKSLFQWIVIGEHATYQL